MARTCIEINQEEFLNLYQEGYPDGEIAAILGVSRPTIVRTRQRLMLKANRRVGERGPSINKNAVFWLTARRLLGNRDLNRQIANAAQEYYAKNNDWDTYFVAMIMEPRDLFHPIPQPYVSDLSKMNTKFVDYIYSFEQRMDLGSMAGVPGPAILRLARVFKTASKEHIAKLAKEAIEEAGLIGCQVTNNQVQPNMWKKENEELNREIIPINPTSVKVWKEYWKENSDQAKQWLSTKEIPTDINQQLSSQSYKSVSYKSRTGKRGKGGGVKSINNYMAGLAINRY